MCVEYFKFGKPDESDFVVDEKNKNKASTVTEISVENFTEDKTNDSFHTSKVKRSIPLKFIVLLL